MNEQRIYRAALAAWGADAQTLMVFEEMAELQKELCKAARGKDNREAIAEEIADVEIMLEQMKEMLHCGDKVAKIREEKLERQIGRIRKRQTEKEEMTSAGAIERLERYRKGAERDERNTYDIKLHNACIKALQERMEREGSGNGI